MVDWMIGLLMIGLLIGLLMIGFFLKAHEFEGTAANDLRYGHAFDGYCHKHSTLTSANASSPALKDLARSQGSCNCQVMA